MAKKIKIVSVGKPKKGFWKKALEFYLKRLKFYFSVKEVIIEPSKQKLIVEKLKEEEKNIIKNLKERDLLICLDEKGKLLTTKQLSTLLKEWLESPKTICFVIGGPYGLTNEVKERSDLIISLSRLTFPHEMAKVILLEQLYRAACIVFNHPYHH